MQTKVGARIEIIDPTDEIIDYCKTELVISNPEFAKKKRMGFWIGNTPRTLNLYESHGEALYLPFGVLKDCLPMLGKGELKTAFRTDLEGVDYGTNTVPLYDYQDIAVNKMIDGHYGILQSKAGSGKTQMGIGIVQRLGMKALWLTHTVDLLNQSKARAEQYLPHDLIGTITDGKVNIGKGITFATVQTMAKLDLASLRDEWECVIVDECHRVAGTPTAMSQFYKVLNNLAARHKYGLSATVHRADGMIQATYALLGQVVYVVPDWAVADKTMTVKIEAVDTGVGISRECQNTDGTLNYTKLITYLSEHRERNKLIADSIEYDKSCLILADRLEQLRAIKEMLCPDMQMDACIIHGKMTSKAGKERREQYLQDMREGKKKYLFATYQLAKEGLDIPRLERLYLASPKRDYAVITQSIGRVARTFPGKETPICYDFVDSIQYLRKCYTARLRIYKKNGCDI